MEPIKILKLTVVTRKLKRHLYALPDEIPKSNEEKSTYENEAAIDPAGELLNQSKDVLESRGYDIKELDLEKSTYENEIEPAAADLAKPESENEPGKKKKKKIKRLRKPNLSLFEEVIDEKEKQKQEAAAIINQDHYYDVVKPYDADTQIHLKGTRRSGKVVGVLVAAIAIVVVLIVWSMGDILL